MNAALKNLIKLFDLIEIDKGHYQGASRDYGQGRLFGGHVLAQALSAAYYTVPETQLCHSLHAYFINAGDHSEPVLYKIDELRLGKRFSTRQINAIQSGKTIFCMNASFQIDEGGFEHQADMPNVGEPEQWFSDYELAHKVQDKIPERIRPFVLAERAIEAREVNPVNPFNPEVRKPERFKWFRVNGRLDTFNQRLQQCLMAYASDMSLMGTGLLPHGYTYWSPKIQAASIDHSMWFHRPIDFSQWHLYHMHSPVASNAKGLNIGHMYTKSGELAVSMAQQGLQRFRPDRS